MPKLFPRQTIRVSHLLLPLLRAKGLHDHVESSHAVTETTAADAAARQDDGEDADDCTAWEIVKQNPAIIGYAISTIIGLPAFATDFTEPFGTTYIIPALWQGLWTAFNQLGAMIGALLNGFLQDRFGRRPMVFLGSFIVSGAVAMGYTSYMPESREARRVLMLMAKILLGVGMGVLMSTCQTYVSEIAPAKIRGTLLGFYTFTLARYPWIFCLPIYPLREFSSLSCLPANTTPYNRTAKQLDKGHRPNNRH